MKYTSNFSKLKNATPLTLEEQKEIKGGGYPWVDGSVEADSNGGNG